VKNKSTQVFVRLLQFGALVALMTLGSTVMLPAETPPEKNTPAPASTNLTATQPAPPATLKADNGSASDGADHKHSATIEIDDDNDRGSGLEADLIPLAGIVATFGTPVLIVFFICYFKYKRRSENLAMVRDYLNKGLPVPPQLLDPSQGGYSPVTKDSPNRPRSDLRQGFRLTFIGLGITLAFYVNNPHSTTWGWGLIPLVMGIGYLISGWNENRHRPPVEDSRTTPPPGNPL